MNKQEFCTDLNIKHEIVSNKKRSILMFSWEYPPNVIGGLSRHVYGLSVHLAKLGHEVHIVTAGQKDLPTFEVENGVNVHRVTPINGQDENFLAWIGGLNQAMAFKAECLALEMKFDLIHAHDWLVGTAAIVIKDMLGIPLLTTIHATEYGRNNGIYNEIQRFIHEKEQQLIQRSDQLIVCSEYMKDSLFTIFKEKIKNISVIPNGVDHPADLLKVCDVFPKIAQRKYIFSIGRMVREKGFETIISAAEIAKEKGLDYYFVIAGKGPMLDHYRHQIAAKKLDAYVDFIGYITDDERNALLKECELVVIPSLYEPFGIVVLEGMILGKPTIVSKTGGLKKIVEHLHTGLLMVPGDPNSLLEQIEFLMNNPDQAKEIGRCGKEMAQDKYGWNRIAFETAKIMEDMI
ncbi:glycosyltransferase family 4 protein [Bacillus sp. BRMEA1]|uniref:glycosyltransferase family 4 protein n=1 Tax=Neobacillus endophyticus TaxID=2738405 RepID=UPI001566E246|nr:glycosyltransferase family 4 protein [Neobacillus endophyticus]NRD80759.1 glycosyltransferase family 4 protein [Neobacillus endophyticus]